MRRLLFATGFVIGYTGAALAGLLRGESLPYAGRRMLREFRASLDESDFLVARLRAEQAVKKDR